MKKIIIIAPDIVPLTLNVDKFPEEEKKLITSVYNCKTTAGVRAWNLAKYLSAEFDVTLLIPDIYYPGEALVDTSAIKFKLDTYSYKFSLWNWSDELDRKLKKTDFVIVQTYSGAGIANCAVLPGEVNVIVDAYCVQPFELGGNLLTTSKIARKVYWNQSIAQYKDLITRANCLLVASDAQTHFYEGLFYGIGKLNYSTLHFSPILKVPYGIDAYDFTTQRRESNKLRLLWYGVIKPWDCPEEILKSVSGLDDIQIDFVNIKHPRENKAYNTYFKSFFDRVNEVANIQIIDNDSRSVEELSNSYDFGINLTRNWTYSSYIHKSIVSSFLSWKLPVITNTDDCLYEELDFVHSYMCPISLQDIDQQLHQLLELKNGEFSIDNEAYSCLQDVLNWDNVISVLKGYIQTF